MAENQRKRSLKIELFKQMITLSTSGFGLVAALAWNSLIQEFVSSYVKRYLPDGSGLYTLLLYAIVVTALAVFITYQLTKIVERLERE